jgi:hypothetical protein
MAENGTGQGAAQPAATPPPAFGSSSTALKPDTKLERRTVTPKAVEGVTVDPKDIVDVSSISPQEATSARLRETAAPASFGYIGQNLVDSNGMIARGQYDVENEAYDILVNFGTTAERLTKLRALQSRGLYGSSKVGATGFDSQDLSVAKDLARYANARGVTADVALNMLLTEFAPQGTGRKIRTTAKEDIRATFRSVARNTLGRDLSPAQIERFVKAYEGMEVTEGTGGVKAPSIQSAAQATIDTQYGAEAGAVGMLSLFDLMDEKIKGLA